MIEPIEVRKLRITVIYDNFGGDARLRADHGFACLVEGPEKTILFDTGLEAALFAANMEALRISPQQVDALFLSHEHGDHIGGLPAFFRLRTDLAVWAPSSFSEPVKAYIRQAGALLEEVDEPRPVCLEAATSGRLSGGEQRPDEHALYIATKEGGVVITGCAHPGIVEIVERARSLMGPEILLVAGGFHLAPCDEPRIRSIVEDFKRLGVRYAAPCHCSGETARGCFRQACGPRYIEVGVGSMITGADLKPVAE